MLKPNFNDCNCDNLSAKSLSYFCYLDLDELRNQNLKTSEKNISRMHSTIKNENEF